MEYLSIISVILNLLMIPVMAMIWGIRVDIAKVDVRLSTVVEGLDKRLLRLEGIIDKKGP